MNSLKSVASSLIPLDVGTLHAHQFPAIYTTSQGRHIINLILGTNDKSSTFRLSSKFKDETLNDVGQL